MLFLLFFLAGDKIDEFEEGYITRFVEVLCNCTKDFLLVTDFFFEVNLSFLFKFSCRLIIIFFCCSCCIQSK